MNDFITSFINKIHDKQYEISALQENNKDNILFYNLADDFIDTIKQFIQAINSLRQERNNLNEKIKMYEKDNKGIRTEEINYVNDYSVLYNEMMNSAKGLFDENENEQKKKIVNQKEVVLDKDVNIINNDKQEELVKDKCDSSIISRSININISNHGLRNKIRSKSKDKSYRSLNNNSNINHAVFNNKSQSMNISNNISQINNNEENDNDIIDNTQLSGFDRVMNNNDEHSVKLMDLTRRILKKVQSTETNQSYFAKHYGKGSYKDFLQRLVDFNFNLDELEQLNNDIDNIEDQPNILPFTSDNKESKIKKNRSISKSNNKYKENKTFETMLRNY